MQENKITECVYCEGYGYIVYKEWEPRFSEWGEVMRVPVNRAKLCPHCQTVKEYCAGGNRL
jgi:hypothetical protein